MTHERLYCIPLLWIFVRGPEPAHDGQATNNGNRFTDALRWGFSLALNVLWAAKAKLKPRNGLLKAPGQT